MFRLPSRRLAGEKNERAPGVDGRGPPSVRSWHLAPTRPNAFDRFSRYKGRRDALAGTRNIFVAAKPLRVAMACPKLHADSGRLVLIRSVPGWGRGVPIGVKIGPIDALQRSGTLFQRQPNRQKTGLFNAYAPHRCRPSWCSNGALVVERTFAWLDTCRRLSKDYEYLPGSSEALDPFALINLMAHRLKPG
jgi:hypothetical protein